MGTPRDFMFGVQIDRQAYKPKKLKSRSKGAWPTSRDLLFFSDLSTSVERHSLPASYNL